MNTAPARPEGDLSVTALYTSQTWVWGGFDGAELLATPEAKVVFDVTNFVLDLVRLFRRRQPDLRHSLVQRHAMLDRLLETAGATQVVELASGLSRRGACVSRQAQIDYVEIDLPHMIARKRQLLARTEAGRAVLERPNLHFRAADVRDAVSDLGIDATRPLCIVAEGLFMYFPIDEQRRMWTRIAEAMRGAPSATFLFDLTPRRAEASPQGRVLSRLMKAFTRGRGFEPDTRTHAEIEHDLETCGFARVERFEPATCRDWALPHASRPTQVLIFRCRT